MRARVTIWLIVLSIALVVCAAFARRSKRPMANDVFILLVSLLPPMIGNLLIIMSGDWLISRIGNYIYFIGMDWTIISLLRFTADYCSMPFKGTKTRFIALLLTGIDIVQLLLNPLFGHAFTTTEIMVEGIPYYALVPFVGQVFHRVVVYGIFFVTVGVFVYKTIRAPRIYLERYLVILLVMVFTGIWQSYYILSGSPVDRSMIGFGLFGLMVFYFSLYYKPMRLLDSMLASIVSNSNDAVLFFDADGQCIYANSIAVDLFGIENQERLESCTEKLVELVSPDGFVMNRAWTRRLTVRNVSEDETTPLWQPIESNGSLNVADYADERFWSVDFQTLDDTRGSFAGSYAIINDRTDEELALRHERYFASHDPLTGLFNQMHLYEAAQQRIQENPEVPYCVVGTDIREFKLFNDVFSKEFGDKILCAIADRIRANAAESAVYGRISGDKFGLVVPVADLDMTHLEMQLSTQDLVEGTVDQPVVVHVGIYDVVDIDMPMSVMFDRAFMAIASIKHDFQRRIAHYDETMREDAIWNQQIAAELDGAIASGQIVPYLQPMVDASGDVVGAEVLVRWNHPEKGLLSPARFIPFFEQNGRIVQLDMHMWECACRILANWQKAGIGLFVSANISPKDFYFIDVPETIYSLVTKYGIDPSKLRLEITENVMMGDIENRLRTIKGLQSMGFLVEMDDFGSGYSSLNMLKDMPVDVLKIDMMFLQKTHDKERARAILQTIINLSDMLGMPSITEGVETEEQVTMLVAMGCRLFQGYYFSRPMPLDQFEESYCSAA